MYRGCTVWEREKGTFYFYPNFRSYGSTVVFYKVVSREKVEKQNVPVSLLTLYRYRFTTPAERAATADCWVRE